MKTLISTNLRTKALAFASLFCAGSASVQAQFIDFTNNVKVIFKTVDVVNSAGETVSGTQATATVTETDSNGVITAKKQTFVQVSDGSGGNEQLVTQETTTATPDAFTGNFAQRQLTQAEPQQARRQFRRQSKTRLMSMRTISISRRPLPSRQSTLSLILLL